MWKAVLNPSSSAMRSIVRGSIFPLVRMMKWIPGSAFGGPRMTVLVVMLFATPAFAINAVTVMSDNTMSVVMVQIARAYSRDRGTVVNTSFVSPVAQETQIKEGGSADILITPRLPWIEQLKTQGLVDIYSQSTIARNRLILAGPADSTLTMRLSPGFKTAPLINAMEGEQAFVVGSPETLMVGTSGKEALRNLDVADDLEPYTLYIKESGQMLDMVTKEHAYGIFFNSSIAGLDGVRAIGLLPEKSYHSISYYAVVIAGENMNQARKFLDYLKSPDTKKLLRENGFVVD